MGYPKIVKCAGSGSIYCFARRLRMGRENPKQDLEILFCPSRRAVRVRAAAFDYALPSSEDAL